MRSLTHGAGRRGRALGVTAGGALVASLALAATPAPAALAADPGWLRRPLRSRDTLLMADALRSLGIGIEETVSSHSTVSGLPQGRGESWRIIPAAPQAPARVDVGNAGTVMRFLPPVAALAEGPVEFDGDPRSHQRPLSALVDALRALGARIDDDGRVTAPHRLDHARSRHEPQLLRRQRRPAELQHHHAHDEPPFAKLRVTSG